MSDISRDIELRRMHRALTMATAGEIHRASKFLEEARQIRLGKRKLREGWRGRTAAQKNSG